MSSQLRGRNKGRDKRLGGDTRNGRGKEGKKKRGGGGGGEDVIWFSMGIWFKV